MGPGARGSEKEGACRQQVQSTVLQRDDGSQEEHSEHHVVGANENHAGRCVFSGTAQPEQSEHNTRRCDPSPTELGVDQVCEAAGGTHESVRAELEVASVLEPNSEARLDRSRSLQESTSQDTQPNDSSQLREEAGSQSSP